MPRAISVGLSACAPKAPSATPVRPRRPASPRMFFIIDYSGTRSGFFGQSGNGLTKIYILQIHALPCKHQCRTAGRLSNYTDYNEEISDCYYGFPGGSQLACRCAERAEPGQHAQARLLRHLEL